MSYRIKLIHNGSKSAVGGGYDHDFTALVTESQKVKKNIRVRFFVGRDEQGTATTNAQGRADFTLHTPGPTVIANAQIVVRGSGDTAYAVMKCTADVKPDVKAVKLEVEVSCRRFHDVGRSIVRVRTYKDDNHGCAARVSLNWENHPAQVITTDAEGRWEEIFDRRRSERLTLQITSFNTTDEENQVTLLGKLKGRGQSPVINFQEIGTLAIGARPVSSVEQHFREGFTGRMPMPQNYRGTSLFAGLVLAALGLIIEPVIAGTFFTPVLALLGTGVIFWIRTSGSQHVRQMNLGYFSGWFWNTNNDKWRLSFIVFLFLTCLAVSWNGVGIPRTVPGKVVTYSLQEQKEWNLRHHLQYVPDTQLPQGKQVRSPKQLKPRTTRMHPFFPWLVITAFLSFIATVVYLPIALWDEIMVIAGSIGRGKKSGTLTSVAQEVSASEVTTPDGRMHTFGDLVKAELFVEVLKNVPKWLSRR